MAAMSDFLENKLVDHLLRGTAYTAPGTLYVALYTTATTDAGAGTEVPLTNNYSRASVVSSGSAWANTQASGTGVSSGTGGVTSNSAAITFAVPSGSWGTITNFGILSAATGGDLLFHGALTVQQTVNTGNTVSFAAGALQITFA